MHERLRWQQKPARRPNAFTVSHWTFFTLSLSDIAFVTRRRRCDQSEAAGSEKPEVYSLEYIEDCFWPRMTQLVTDRLPQ
jgi:hypothetical protein